MVGGNPLKPPGLCPERYNMNITVFAKRRTTQEGKHFYSYLTTLKKNDGTELTTAIKFQESCGNPKPEECPLNIIVDKKDANLSVKKFVNPETGEAFDSHTLWVKNWTKDSNVWSDTSLDDFE